jgi:hypothetical protein
MAERETELRDTSRKALSDECCDIPDGEEPRNLYASPNVVRVIRPRNEMSGACSTHGRDKCIQYFDWKTWVVGCDAV